MFASKETGVSSIPSELASVDEDKIINVSTVFILIIPCAFIKIILNYIEGVRLY